MPRLYIAEYSFNEAKMRRIKDERIYKASIVRDDKA
jgi:hypothetical protein